MYAKARDSAIAKLAADPTNTQWQRTCQSATTTSGTSRRRRGPGRRPYRLPGEPGHPVRWRPPIPPTPSGNATCQSATTTSGASRAAPGDLTAARTAYQASLDIASRLAAADPTNTEWQRDLSVSHNKIGGVAEAAGDLTAARTAYQAGLDIAVRLAAADPTNTGWQRDLSVSHNKIGGVAVAAGDLTAARTAYQAGLDIRARLAAADPTNTGWQRDLSVSHDNLGRVAVAAGDLTAARTAYQASLDIAGPVGGRRSRQHRVAARPVGQPRQDRRPRGGGGRPDRRAYAYQAGLDIAVRLAAADPSNTGWQRDLSVSHNKIGDLAAAAGDLAAARTRLPGGPRHRETGWPPPIPATPSGSATCRSATTRSATSRWRRGDLTAARTAYQAGLDIAVRLAAADPGNTEWQRDLSVSHNKIGDVAVAAGDLTAARTAYQAGLDIRERLAAADPGNTEWQRDLSVSHNKVGDVRWRRAT